MGHSLTGFCPGCDAPFCRRYYELAGMVQRLRELGDATRWDRGDLDIGSLVAALARLERPPDRAPSPLELLGRVIPWIAPGLRPFSR